MGVVVLLLLFQAFSVVAGDTLDNAQYDQLFQLDTVEEPFARFVEKRTGDCIKPSAQSGRTVEQLNEDYLAWHNYYRCLHGVGPLEYDETLQEVAKANVNKNIENSDMELTSNNEYGENLWMIAKAEPDFGINNIKGQDPVKSWHDEMTYYRYNFEAPIINSDYTAQFSQLVWKDTTRTGCWTAEHPYYGMTRVFVACEYDPPGNGKAKRATWIEQVAPPIL